MILESFQLILRTRDITGMTVPAILNSNNEHLDENEGFAHRIMNAGSAEVAVECQSHKRIYTVLPVAAVVHTTSGKMKPKISLSTLHERIM